MNDAEQAFIKLRPRLMALAYRMLGNISDSEDIVQETWLRFAKIGGTDVEYPTAYFTKIATRLCLDQLKSARHKREKYIGTWLPEPVDEKYEFAVEAVENNIDISYAIMLTLEQLTPLERAAYLLHDLFEIGFDEIAEVLERNVSTCRKLASRARQHLAKREKRFASNQATFEKLLAAFSIGSQTGDLSALRAQLAEDVKYYADGGGKISAALNVILGSKSVAKMIIGLAKKNDFINENQIQFGLINGQMGMILIDKDGAAQPICFDLNEDGKIAAIYSIRNPDKLLRFGV